MSSGAVQKSGKCCSDDWVVDVSEEKNELKNWDVAVSVCQVLKWIKASKTEDFVPEFVGLGPYHHFRSNLVMSHKLKLGSAQRGLQLGDAKLTLQQCQAKLASECDVYGFYHADVSSKYGYKTLLSALSLDSLFLLGLLQRGTNPEGASFFLTGKHGMPLVNASGVELTMDAIVRDVFMLENQIPSHFLRLIAQVSGNNQIERDLDSAVWCLCKEFRPLHRRQIFYPCPENFDHLLHFMYQITVGESADTEESQPDPPPELEPESESDSESEPMPDFLSADEACFLVLVAFAASVIPGSKNTPSQSEKREEGQTTSESDPLLPEVQQVQPQDRDQERRSNWFKDRFMDFIRIMMAIFLIMVFLFQLLIFSLRYVLRLFPWLFRYLFRKGKQVLLFIRDKLQDMSLIIEPMLNLMSRYDAEIPSLRRYTTQVRHAKRIREEFMGQTTDLDTHARPSATELRKAGIHFRAHDESSSSITSIKFDEERCRFCLPRMKLNASSEVIIKNLVAYESMMKKSFVFTRYIELMASLIQTPEDVLLLKRQKIIHTNLSKQAAAEIFSEMRKSIGPTNSAKLDEEINKVYSKFESSRKLRRFILKFSSGRGFAIIAGLTFLILTLVQTVCSFANCSRRYTIFGQPPQDGDYGT